MNDENLLKEAYKLRSEFYNKYTYKETKWHDKYKQHELYKTVVESFDYKFHEIAQVMPKLLQNIK